jgi:hypothetical protein
MPRDYARLRITSPDGFAHTSTVTVVAPDGTETPLGAVVMRCELTCDAEVGVWKAALWVDEVEVDVVVDDVETQRVAVEPAATKES